MATEYAYVIAHNCPMIQPGFGIGLAGIWLGSIIVAATIAFYFGTKS